MAYDANNLSALTYANGFTLWHYKTPDAEIDKPDGWGDNYFDEAASMLRTGDFMFINSGSGSGLYVVTENFKGKVTILDLTSFNR